METKYIKTNYGNYPVKTFKPVFESKGELMDNKSITYWKCDGLERYEWEMFFWQFCGAAPELTDKHSASACMYEIALENNVVCEICLPDRNAPKQFNIEAAQKRLEELRNKKPKAFNKLGGRVMVDEDGSSCRLPARNTQDFQTLVDIYEMWEKEGYRTKGDYWYRMTVLSVSKLLYLTKKELKEYFTLAFILMIDYTPVEILDTNSFEMWQKYSNARNFNNELITTCETKE